VTFSPSHRDPEEQHYVTGRQRGRFLDAVGRYREGLEEGEDATRAQKLARKMFGLMGRLTGVGAVEDVALETEEEDGEETSDNDQD